VPRGKSWLTSYPASEKELRIAPPDLARRDARLHLQRVQAIDPGRDKIIQHGPQVAIGMEQAVDVARVPGIVELSEAGNHCSRNQRGEMSRLVL